MAGFARPGPAPNLRAVPRDDAEPVRLSLQPADASLLGLALERLIQSEGPSPVGDRAVVLAAYLRLERHRNARRDGNPPF
jgi:hypothetical protein